MCGVAHPALNAKQEVVMQIWEAVQCKRPARRDCRLTLKQSWLQHGIRDVRVCGASVGIIMRSHGLCAMPAMCSLLFRHTRFT